MKDGLQDVGFCFYCFVFFLLHDLIVERGRRICEVDPKGEYGRRNHRYRIS